MTEIEDPVSEIASTLNLRSPFTGSMQTAGSHLYVMIVATAVEASEAPVVASFLEKSVCKTLLCRRQQLSTLQVLLLQSFNRSPGLRQLEHSLKFCACFSHSFSFIG